jgi:hypothetical protein
VSVNKDNILRWVEALESGEYQQGVGYLHNRDNNLFCCLGVACDLAYKDGAVTKHEVNEDDSWASPKWAVRYGSPKLSSVLPYEVVEWLGIASAIPSVEYDGGRTELTVLNDGHGCSFAEIAQFIRNEYLMHHDDAEVAS